MADVTRSRITKTASGHLRLRHGAQLAITRYGDAVSGYDDGYWLAECLDGDNEMAGGTWADWVAFARLILAEDAGRARLADPGHAGAFAAADAYRARAAKAEAALVALIARLDAGGRPADVLADLGVILDEARSDLQAGDLPSCSS